MTPRAYVISAALAAVVVLGVTAAANFSIDPQGVFGSTLISNHLNPNGRYRAYQTYAAAPANFDAVLFGSSRARVFDRPLLARYLDAHEVANFSVPFGMMTDFLPILELMLRDNARGGSRLRAVFLLLDADYFGEQPWTNSEIGNFWPPEVSGESRFRFWWRYLTVFQYNYWRVDVSSALGMLRRPAPIVKAITGPTVRPDLVRQTEMLKRFVELCRAHNIRLIVALPPISRQNMLEFDANDIDRNVERISSVVSVWDFGRPDWLSDRANLWEDKVHFSTAVSTIMLNRIFGFKIDAPEDFGRFRSQ
jgi:hypothetical protein